MSDWIETAKQILTECSYPDYAFTVEVSRTGAVYLQATYLEADTTTGKIEEQFTRRWFLSPSMGKSEVVATAFKCILTSMEHRTREWFLYNGRAIYQPHYDVDALYAICEQREVRDDLRQTTSFHAQAKGCSWSSPAEPMAGRGVTLHKANLRGY